MYAGATATVPNPDIDEKNLQLQHNDYWKSLVKRKIALVFGPVYDPDGAFACSIVEVADKAAVETIINDDPLTGAGLDYRCDIFSMMVIAERS